MNLYNLAPIRALLTAAHWVVTHLTDLLTPIAGTSAAVMAIILLTLLVRTLLIPVGVSQAKAQATRARLAPQLADLNKRYKNQPEVLRQKMMEMYAEEGANPAAGCLPVLAQMPVLMAVYGLFIQPMINGAPNRLLDHSLAGVPLKGGFIAQAAAGALTPTSIAVFGVVIGLIAVVAHLTRRILPLTGAPTPGGGGAGGMGMAGMTKIMGYLPFLTGIIAAVVPLAAAVYLATTTAWTLAERVILTRRYPVPAP